MKSDVAGAPKHIGIIMDGNGRWATKRLMPRKMGHRAGVKNITPVIRTAFDAGVKCITLYALSTENKGRDPEEIDALIDLIRKRIKPMSEELNENGARVMFSGDTSYFPEDVEALLAEAAAVIPDGSDKTVNIALNYGARTEIVRAARLAARSGEITLESFEQNLYTASLPDLDMIIRTGGEKRLSNFLLYQAAYAELFFTDTLWPDFDGKELKSMLDEFLHRTRRFGK